MQSKYRKSIYHSSKLLILLLILFCILNTFSEILLIRGSGGFDIEESLKGIHNSKELGRDFMKQHAIDQISAKDTLRFDYALGPVYDYSNATSFKGDTKGRRVTSDKYIAGKTHQGALLGASFTWGYFLPEEDILSRILSTRINDVGIDDHSFKGKTLESLLVYFQTEKTIFENKEFIIVVGGTVDVSKSCFFDPESMITNDKQKNQNPLGVMRFMDIIKNRLVREEPPHCHTPQDLQSVFQRIFNYIDLLEINAKKQHKRLLVVVPPVRYKTGQQSKFRIDDAYAYVYSEFDKELSKRNYKFVLNLLHSFDDAQNYFIDDLGHPTSAGQQKIAEDIIKKVRPEFFDGRAIEADSSYLVDYQKSK